MCLLGVEPLQRTISAARIFVAVGTFPVLEVERALWEQLQGILLLGFLRNKVAIILIIVLSNFLRLLFLLFWCGRGGGRLLLFGRDVLQRLLGVLSRTVDSFEFGLMHNSLQEANSVDEVGAYSGICGDTNGALENRRNSDISKSDAVANEEGTGAQMSFEGVKAAQLVLSHEGVDL